MVGVGCSICKRAGRDTLYSRCDAPPDSVQISNLLRHMKSPMHRAAHAKLYGLPALPRKQNLTKEHIELVLNKRREGGSLRQLTKDTGWGRKKVLRVQFAIAEAMRCQAREQLAKATSFWHKTTLMITYSRPLFQDNTKCILNDVQLRSAVRKHPVVLLG